MKQTRLQFMQDILSGKKKALRAHQVPSRQIPRWNELAVKIIYP